jgi:hypothetical protein
MLSRCCSVVRLHSAARPAGSTLHFKGFGRGVDYNHPAVKWAFHDVAKFVHTAEPTYLAFDGDPYRPDSFTAMLPGLLEGTVNPRDPPQPRLLVFKYDTEENLAEVEDTWQAAAVPGGLRLLAVPEDPSGEDNPESWAALGGIALRFTGAHTALCFGGGDTIALEVRSNPEVTFHVWPVPRAGRDGQLQQCALSSLALGNVVLHDIPEQHSG